MAMHYASPPAQYPMRRTCVTALMLAAALLAATPLPTSAQEPERGRLLYENSCIGCHGRSVFSRANRIARNYAGVRAQVLRWQDNAGLSWSASEIDDVTSYLNRAVYKFKPPQG